MPRFSDLDTALATRRYLACAVATRCPRTITEALEFTEGRFVAESQGVRLMALGQLGQPEVIHARPPAPAPQIAQNALEDACDTALARGIAARSLRAFDEAHAELSVALFLARSLQMRHREQHAMLEIAQMQGSRGRPCPEMIEEALAMPIPISERRKTYGMQALAEACMAAGDYQRARELVVIKEGPQTALWAFASALLGDRVARDAQASPGVYLSLAEAVWALRDGTEMAMPSCTPNSPEAEYGDLLRAVAMLRSRPLLRQARRVLVANAPMSPDQRVWQLASLIYVEATGEGEADVGGLMREFQVALGQLRTREHVLPLLRALMPEAYMLLALLPYAHPDVEDSLTDLPILTGEGVTCKFHTYKLPGKAAGSAVWVKAAAMNSQQSVHRQARGRVRDALAVLGLGEVLNLGVALRAILLLAQRAPASERGTWRAALEHALDWVDSDVLRNDLAAEFGIGRKAT